MKRFFVIFTFFVLAFSIMVLSSCNGGADCTELNTARLDCRGSLVPVTTKGCSCHIDSCFIDDSPYDLIWYPFTLGCYDSGSCSCGSFVVLGVDFSLLECYGRGISTFEDPLSNLETREVVTAVEGEHYTIDRVSITVDNQTMSFYEDVNSLDDLDAFMYDFIKLLNLKTATEIQFCVEYTALTELHSVRIKSQFEYNNDLQHTFGVNKYMGNNANDETAPTLKSKNIQPGKHVIVATASLDIYEVLSLEGISDIELIVKAYEE